MAKRANGEGTHGKRKDGRFMGQVTVTTPDGRRTRKTVYGATQAEMLAKKRAVHEAAKRGAVSTSRPPTVSEYGESWLTETLKSRVEMGTLAPATWLNYRDLWVRHVEPYLGNYRLDALTAPLLRRWLGARAVEPRPDGKSLSAATVQRIHATLRKALNDAVKDGLLPANPMLAVDGPSVPRYKARFLAREEADTLRDLLVGDPLETLVTLMLACGLRVGEALGLRWSDVDWDAARISVERTVGDLPGEMTMTSRVRPRGVKKTKTDASADTVPVPAFALEVLRRHRVEVSRQQLAAVVWHDEDLVFPSSIGTLQDRNNIAKKWLALRDKAGLHNMRLHDLRHSTATFLLAAGAPMKSVQEVLRHSRFATTTDVYTHVLPEMKDEAARLLNAYLTGDTGS